MTTSAIIASASAAAHATSMRRRELERQISTLSAEIDQLPEASPTDGLRIIADAVAQSLPDLEVELLGPQGVDCLMSIHARRNGVTLASMTFRPMEDMTYRVVDYSRNTGEYPADSMGARAGMNHPDMPMPEEIHHIVEQLRSEMVRRTA